MMPRRKVTPDKKTKALVGQYFVDLALNAWFIADF
jgi:hypothetical protein